jgi:prophage DNA circulation protein
MSTKDPKALIAQARKALESKKSAAQLDTLHGKLKARISERAGRLKAITANGDWGSPGPERQKLVAAGDVDTLRKLDEEERSLGPELEVLRSLQDKLRRRLDEQRASEYAAAMPDAFAELGDMLADLEAMQDAARKARQAVDAKLKEIHEQRHHVARQAASGQKLELTAAQPELLRKFMAVKGYAYKRTPMMTGWFTPAGNPGDPQQLRNVAAVLGLDVPSPVRAA